MKRAKNAVLLVFGVLLTAQSTTTTYQLPVWVLTTGSYTFPYLGASFKVTGNTIDVAPFAPNDVYSLTGVQSIFLLKCAMADMYRNGIMQSEGVDLTLDRAALTVTFVGSSVPQAGDVVKITYRCVR